MSFKEISNNVRKAVELKQKNGSYIFASILADSESLKEQQDTESDEQEKSGDGADNEKPILPTRQQKSNRETAVGRVPKRPEISYKPNQDISDLVGR